MLQYTPEQSDIIDFITNKDGILLVSAGAGTGKSFMSEKVASILKPSKGLYTAFNKAIVKEGVKRFENTNVECKTLHALAYRYVKPKKDIEDITYSCITENIAYKLKAETINAINMFYVSSSVDMYGFYNNYFKNHKKSKQLIELCEKYTEAMIDGSINPTFNFLLKYFHLMLVEEKVRCEYDLVILDEINDVTAVSLEIFKLIKAPKKLGLGETNQAIYKFLNLVDGFEEMSNEKILNLTQSWRCSEDIAKRIQKFMKKEVSENFNFVGTDKPVANGNHLYCTMTNAFIISKINSCLENNQGFYLLRRISDIFAAPLAISSAASGKEPYQKKFKFLADEYKNYCEEKKPGQSYMSYLLENVDDDEIQNAVKLLLSFKRKDINLFDIYRRAKEAKVDHSYTIATVFTAKGLEYETVEIGKDLNTKINSIRENGGIQDSEDLAAYRCYYVATSRAGTELINATCLPN